MVDLLSVFIIVFGFLGYFLGYLFGVWKTRLKIANRECNRARFEMSTMPLGKARDKVKSYMLYWEDKK